jgi:hypothetical protein
MVVLAVSDATEDTGRLIRNERRKSFNVYTCKRSASSLFNCRYRDFIFKAADSFQIIGDQARRYLTSRLFVVRQFIVRI